MIRRPAELLARLRRVAEQQVDLCGPQVARVDLDEVAIVESERTERRLREVADGMGVADGEVTNRVLGWDYIGSMLAGLSFPLALLPFFNLTVIGFATAAVNLAVGALVLRRFVAPDERTGGRTWATAGVAAVLLLGIVQSGSIEQYFLKRYYFYTDAAERGSPFGALGDLPHVQRAYSPYQQIDLLHDPAPRATGA